jgi:hypothetical protein
MAKFVFPITEEQFYAVLKPEAKKLFARLGDEDDPLGKAFSCISHGWKSKLYHKDSMGVIKEENKLIRARMKADPELRRRILGLEK